MLRARRARTHETAEEVEAGAAKDDIAITPLAVPMLAGPGAISTVVLFQSRAVGWQQEGALLVAIALVMWASFWILALSARGARWLSPIALRVTERVMGLLLASVAMQFLINALRDLKLVHN
jgi:multiple antibiotic resistance protein